MRRKAKVLVVDDEKLVVDMLVEYLEKRDYCAVGVCDGKTAMKEFEGGNYDLVITDLVMPEMDGMDLLEAMKAINPRVMVLMISGYGTIERAVAAIREGAYDFIPKPIKFDSLQVIIDRALDRHSLFRQLGVFRGLTLALIISVPVWLILGVALALLW